MRTMWLIVVFAALWGCSEEVIPANPDVGVRIRDLTVGTPGPVDASLPFDAALPDSMTVDAMRNPADASANDATVSADTGASDPGKPGDPCEGNSDCESGICAPLGPGGASICVELCGAEGACPEGTRCQDGFCVPGIADAGMPDEMDADVEDAGAEDAEADVEVELDMAELDEGVEFPDAGIELDAAEEVDSGQENDEGVEVDVEPPEFDCIDLNGCILACGNDANCRRLCREQASAEVRLSRAEMRSCVAENACEGRGYHADLVCAYRNCAEEMSACFGPAPLPMGRSTCGELLVCLDGCPEGISDCAESCVADTAPEAYRTYVQIAVCIDDSGCEPADVVCAREACGPTIDRCILERVAPGELSCTDILECARRCDAGDELNCERRCVVQGTREAVSSWNDFDACRQATGCEGLEACVEACEPAANACQGIEDPGPVDDERREANQSCVDLHDCLGRCAGDLLCEVDCIGAATPVALEMFTAINDCIDLNQCSDLAGNLSRACFFQNCDEQYLQCFGDGGMPRGEQTCAQFNACLGACGPEDAICLNRCNELASPEAFILYWRAIDCIESSGCAAGDGLCQENLCGPQIQGCLGARQRVGRCENTCAFANDGDCDDGGPNSDFAFCELGTDCGDCGPR